MEIFFTCLKVIPARCLCFVLQIYTSVAEEFLIMHPCYIHPADLPFVVQFALLVHNHWNGIVSLWLVISWGIIPFPRFKTVVALKVNLKQETVCYITSKIEHRWWQSDHTSQQITTHSISTQTTEKLDKINFFRSNELRIVVFSPSYNRTFVGTVIIHPACWREAFKMKQILPLSLLNLPHIFPLCHLISSRFVRTAWSCWNCLLAPILWKINSS